MHREVAGRYRKRVTAALGHLERHLIAIGSSGSAPAAPVGSGAIPTAPLGAAVEEELEAEVAELLKAVKGDTGILCKLLYGCGLRISEALRRSA